MNKLQVNIPYKLILSYIITFFITLLLFFGILKLHYTVSVFLATISCYLVKFYKKEKINYLELIIHIIINVIIMHFMLLKVSKNAIIICPLMTIFTCFYYFLLNDYQNDLSILKNITKKINSWWNVIVSKKYISTIFKFMPQNIFTFLLMILSIITIVKFDQNTNDNYYVFVNNTVKDNIGPITEKTKVDISFVDTFETIDTMCFKFMVPPSHDNTSITFQIEDGGSILYQEAFNTNNLSNGSDKCFNIGKTDIINLKDYDIYLIPKESTSVSLYNDKNNIVLSLGKTQKENVKPIRLGIIIFAIISFIIVNYIINNKKLSIEKYFLLCLIYFVPIMLIMPPLQVPDEHFHFYKSYNLSFINFNELPNKVINNQKILVPEDIECINYANLGTANRVYTSSNFPSCLKNTNNISIKNAFAGYKSFFGYFPQSIGIKLADIFTNSSLIIFYAGRLTALLFSVLIIYLAIKITPKYKNLFLITSTMMMFVQEMVSYSYDTVLNAICFLFMALLLKLITDKDKLNIWHILLITLLLIMIIDIKAIYLSLALLLFLIPKEKFNGKLFKKIVIVTIITLSAIFISQIFTRYFSHYNISIPSTDDISKLQIEYLLSNPLNIVRIAVDTLDSQLLFYLKSITGYFAYFTFSVSNIYIIVYFVLFAYVILSESSNNELLKRIILIISSLIAIAGIFAAMYLYSSEYKSPFVAGVQGRYFYPILIPLIIAILPKKAKYEVNQKAIFDAINILLLQMVLVFAVWYY